MLKIKFSFVFLCASLVVSAAANRNQREMHLEAGPSTPDWSNLVVAGDSLSAGVENFSLLDTQQPHGYAYLIAHQAGSDLILPLVSFPGVPNVLELVSLGPPPVITPAQSTMPPLRENPLVQNTNVSVPGVTVNQALTVRPTLDLGPTTPAIQVFATYVLGFPSLFLGQSPTEIELATKLDPSVLIEWLGNNDALVPALIGQLSALTPLPSFAADYKTVLDRLAGTSAPIITANIPDVTEVPYFMSVPEIAEQYGLRSEVVTDELGIGPLDSVRITGAPLVDRILTGQQKGPLPAACPTPEAGLSAGDIPCVLTAAQADEVRSAIACYNDVIRAQSVTHGALMVDVESLVDRLYRNGYAAGNVKLNLNFLGGITSLDGVHPTNSGYAIIANEFIETINHAWKTRIPEVNVAGIIANDPLVFPQIIASQDAHHRAAPHMSCGQHGF
jgi:phospholipase/lecithinase/hemolysin